MSDTHFRALVMVLSWVVVAAMVYDQRRAGQMTLGKWGIASFLAAILTLNAWLPA